jgi:hypothetical protein
VDRPEREVRGGDDDRDDQQGGEDAGPQPPGPRGHRDRGRLGARQVGQQPAQVRLGLGSHRLVEALIELGLAEPAVAVVPG